MEHSALAMFGLPGGAEWIVIGVIALLIFGRRLPDVARSVGKSIVEFKKGIKDVKDDVEMQSNYHSTPSPRLENNNNEESPAQAKSTDSVDSHSNS